MGPFTSTEERMLPGRDEAGPVTAPPLVQGTESAPRAEGLEQGAERTFWTRPGVSTTAVGYAGGISEGG